MRQRVAIVGGGLGGLTCAKTLVDRGYDVTVFEGQARLGGRASTYRDADGDWIEQGLHLFLGTYARFKELLREIDAPPEETLIWMDHLRFREPGGPSAAFGVNPLTSPVATTLRALLQIRYIGPIDKAAVVPLGLLGLRSLDWLRDEYDQTTVTELWRRQGGNQTVMERVLRPLCRAIQFTDADDVSAYNFLGWIHHAIYGFPHIHAGGYRGPRDETIFRPLASYLERRGAQIKTQCELTGVVHDTERDLIGGLAFKEGRRVEADFYVLAIPPWSLAPTLPESLGRRAFFASIARLPVAPAIAVQLWFDKAVLKSNDFTLMASSPVPVYQQQAETYGDKPGTRISAAISPADAYLDWSDERLVDLTLDWLRRVERGVLKARVRKAVVLKHEHHLVRPLPGAMSSRPPQTTPISNLFLAGDWTDQDYFGSQEGAVRGGLAAARAILAARETPSGRRVRASRGRGAAPPPRAPL